MPKATIQKFETERRLFSPAFVFSLCALFTTLAWFVASLLSASENSARFDRSAASMLYAFKNNMGVYTNALVYTRNLFNLKPNLSAQEFGDFVRDMDLRKEYPGITVVGYIQRLTQKELREGLSRLPIRSKENLGILKDQYDVVVYAESLIENAVNALGLDLSVSLQRYDAMNRAMETGEPVATNKVTRLSAPEAADAGSLFLVFVPHYRNGAPLTTVEERRAALVGFVYGGFRAPVLFGNIAGDAKMQDTKLIMRIYDGLNTDPENLVYEKGKLEEASSQFDTEFALQAANHNWKIVMRAKSSFAPAYSRYLPLMILFVGMILTLAVTVWARKGQLFARRLQEDIVIRHHTEALLSEARLQADAANRAKSLFLANVSHEIRTPLGIMLGFAELTLEQNTDPSVVDNNMKKILRNGRELTRIIGEVLDLSKIEANALLIENSTIPTAPFLEELRGEWKQQVNAKKIDFKFTVEGTLPTELRTDSTRLMQILTNLLNNALKFTEHGEIRLLVKCCPVTDVAGEAIQFLVEDTGLGISEENKLQLFQTFSQGDSSITRRFGGSGLGLALSKQLAQALGGDLVLERSRLNEGSLFVLTLPAKRDAQADTSAPGQRPARGHIDLEGVRILLVEDSIDNQELITSFLEMAKATVTTAENGEVGVAKALAGDYDLVLMDIQMPVLDGYGAFAKLNQAGFDRPVIALTAHALIEEKDKAFQMGFYDYLTKPLNRAALIRAISEATLQRTLKVTPERPLEL